MSRDRKAMLTGVNPKTVSGAAVLVLFLATVGTAWASEGGGHALNWTDFFLRLMNFTIMLLILVKLLKKPAANFFQSRTENIEKLLEELEAKKQAAEQKAADYKTRLDRLEQETQQIVDEYIQEGEREKQKIVEAAEKQADYVKQQARFTIQQEMKAAKDSLQEEIAELSVKAAGDLLQKSIRPADQARLVKEFTTKAVEAK